MKNINDGGAAFPVVSVSGGTHCGMSLRDYFAAKAMQSFLQDRNYSSEDTISPDDHRKALAIVAYKNADAMLLARGIAP